MTECSCGSEVVRIGDTMYSPHYLPSHYSRVNKGKKKAKELSRNAKAKVATATPQTEAEVRAELDENFAAQLKNGSVK